MRFKFLNTALVSLVFIITCLTSVANAELIKTGNIISDTDTGLDWFALTATTGNSYNTMSSLFSDSNSIYFGYEYASFQQLETLWQSAGYISTITPTADLYGGNKTNNNANDFLALQLLTGLFGVTGTNCCDRSSGIYKATSGTDRLIWDWMTETQQYSTTWTQIKANPEATSWSFNNEIGHWLIRETPKDVPEPSTLAIFALGLIGLASRRFKK
ncbi:MAG: hypothetical protein ACI9EK_002196 [Psychroserpens sp.]|jgi:hypothetical protein